MSLRRIRAKSFLALAGIGLLMGLSASIGTPQGTPGSAPKVEGPFQSENLAIYRIHGKQTNTHRYVTLDETMRDHTVVKRSIQGEKSQSGVWAEVAREEVKAREIVAVAGESPAPALSATGTYNAIVADSRIRAHRADYVNALLPRLEKANDAVGVVVAVNGEITAADVYGSSVLFHKLARKLLESYALEAVLARNQEKRSAAPPGKEAALTFLTDVSQAPGKDEKVAGSIHRKTRETQKAVMYEYVEPSDGNTGSVNLLHRNVVKK